MSKIVCAWGLKLVVYTTFSHGKGPSKNNSEAVFLLLRTCLFSKNSGKQMFFEKKSTSQKQLFPLL